MSDNVVTLTARERDLLISRVDRELRDTRSEFWRTDNYEFREHVVAEEEKLLRELLDTLRPSPVSSSLRMPK